MLLLQHYSKILSLYNDLRIRTYRTVFSSYLVGLNIMIWRSIFRKPKRWSWGLLLWSPIFLPIQSSIGSIEQVTFVKLLGLHLDANFSWRSHVEAMLSKTTKRLYFLKLLKHAGVPCAQLQQLCGSNPANLRIRGPSLASFTHGRFQ